MSRTNQWLIAMAFGVVSIWGCADSQSTGPSAADRLKALETKNAKLEDDFRAVVAARDQLRRKLAAAEDQQAQLQKEGQEQLQKLTQERDDLRQQVVARTGERDVLMGQFEQVRKGIKELLGQVDAASLKLPTEPATAAVKTNPAGKL